MIENFQILTRRVEDLHDPVVRQNVVEGLQINPLGEGIDEHFGFAAGRLDQAELGPEGAFAYEFGVHCNEVTLHQRITRGLEFLFRCNQFHRDRV